MSVVLWAAIGAALIVLAGWLRPRTYRLRQRTHRVRAALLRRGGYGAADSSTYTYDGGGTGGGYTYDGGGIYSGGDSGGYG